MNYALVGWGRMGRAIEEQATARGHHKVWSASSATDLAAALASPDRTEIDAAFEFTRAEAAEANVIALLGAGVPTVCGTTGWEAGSAFTRAVEASSAGVVLSPNYSAGVNLFLRLVAHAGRLVSALDLHEPYVIERHHRGKRDVPSGTARRLAEILREADPRLRSVVEGHPEGRLPDGALQVLGIRAGAEPGTHSVGFDGELDSIVITHAARGRTGFALGAVLAAEWLGGRRGLHDFDEVVDSMLERCGAKGGTLDQR